MFLSGGRMSERSTSNEGWKTPWIGKEGKVLVWYNTYLAYTLVMNWQEHCSSVCSFCLRVQDSGLKERRGGGILGNAPLIPTISKAGELAWFMMRSLDAV